MFPRVYYDGVAPLKHENPECRSSFPHAIPAFGEGLKPEPGEPFHVQNIYIDVNAVHFLLPRLRISV